MEHKELSDTDAGTLGNPSNHGMGDLDLGDLELSDLELSDLDLDDVGDLDNLDLGDLDLGDMDIGSADLGFDLSDADLDREMSIGDADIDFRLDGGEAGSELSNFDPDSLSDAELQALGITFDDEDQDIPSDEVTPIIDDTGDVVGLGAARLGVGLRLGDPFGGPESEPSDLDPDPSDLEDEFEAGEPELELADIEEFEEACLEAEHGDICEFDDPGDQF